MCCPNLESRARDLLIAVVNNTLVFGFVNVILLLYCIVSGNDDSFSIANLRILVFVLGLFMPMLSVGVFFGLLSIGPCRTRSFIWVSIFFYVIALIITALVGYLLSGEFSGYYGCWGFWLTTTLGVFSLGYLIVRSYLLQKHLFDKGKEQLIIEGDIQFAETPKLREFKIALYILLITQFLVCTITGGIFFGATQATEVLTTAKLAYPFGLAGCFYIYMTIMGLFLLNSPFEQYYKSLMVFETISAVFVVGLTAWILILNPMIIFFLLIVIGFWAAIMGTTATVIKRKMLATTIRHIQLQEEDIGDVELEGQQQPQEQEQEQEQEQQVGEDQTHGHY